MADNKCGGCGRFISTSTLEGVKCSECQALYNRVCVGVHTRASITPNWHCPECKKNIVRDNRTETPVRGSAQCPQASSRNQLTQTVCPVNAAATPPELGISKANVATRELSPVASYIQVMIEELRAVRAEIQVFRKEIGVEMAELKTTLNTCSTRIDGLEARVDALKQRATSSTTNSANVDKIVEKLRQEINKRDRDLLAKVVEVSNLPEVKLENPAHIIKVMGHNSFQSVLYYVLHEQPVD